MDWRAWWRQRLTAAWDAWRASRTLGRRGERAAERYLKRLGWTIVARGERGTLGEVDLIAVDGRTIVFVEVKTRRSNRRGEPSDAVDLRKQWRLTRLALVWLKRHLLLDQRTRFDVISIVWPQGARRPRIEHVRAAFEAVGRWQLWS